MFERPTLKQVDGLRSGQLNAAVADALGWHGIKTPVHAAGGFGTGYRGTPRGCRRASDEQALPNYAESAELALKAIDAFKVKHRSYSISRPDGTSAEPTCYCTISTGNHNVIAEGWGGSCAPAGLSDLDEERWEAWESDYDMSLAICRAIVKAAIWLRADPHRDTRLKNAPPYLDEVTATEGK